MTDSRDGEMFTIRMSPEQAYVFLLAGHKAETETRTKMTRRGIIDFLARHYLGEDAVNEAITELENGDDD